MPAYGSQTHHAGKILGGAPELVVEVADSSRPVDLGSKRSDYERAGVIEYIVVALDPDELFWYVRRGDHFERLAPDADGLYRSQRFPGLWLDAAALFADDGATVRAVLEQGLATAEHARFIADLAGRARA